MLGGRETMVCYKLFHYVSPTEETNGCLFLSLFQDHIMMGNDPNVHQWGNG